MGCNLELHLNDDYIYRVTSPFDSVVNHGNLCVKGRFGYDFIYHPKRVTTPLMRRTPQAPGAAHAGLRPLRMARGLLGRSAGPGRRPPGGDLPARRAAGHGRLRLRQGDQRRQLPAAEDVPRAFRTNNIDHCTRLCHAGSVVALQMALGSSAMSNTAAEVIHNDVFIVTGSNTTENHPIIALQMKAAVEKYGAKMIVVDPRRMELVDFAELWLPHKPGTNVPVFSAMAHVIVKEKLFNQQFVGERTEGFEEFAASMEKFTPEYAEAISGVRPRADRPGGPHVCHRAATRPSTGRWASRSSRTAPPAPWR